MIRGNAMCVKHAEAFITRTPEMLLAVFLSMEIKFYFVVVLLSLAKVIGLYRQALWN
jgi:hypothetical protein